MLLTISFRISKVFGFCLGIAVSLLPLTTVGQEPIHSSSQRASEAAKKSELRGTIVKSTTGVPLEGTTLVLRPAGWEGREQTTTSDSEGRFRIVDVEPGPYFLDAQATGFPTQRYAEDTSNAQRRVVWLKAGVDTGEVLFRLVPGGIITGAVYGEDGDAIVGSHVAALGRARGRMYVAVEAETDNQGKYRLCSLPPGRYYIIAGDVNESRTGVYPPTFYPNASQFVGATPVQVLADVEASGINIHSSRLQGVRVRGSVVSSAKRAIARSTNVQLLPRDTLIREYFYEARFGSTIDDKGGFEFHSVPPGIYTLYASMDQPDRGYSGRVEVSIGEADVSDISLMLRPNVNLIVHLLTNSEKKVEFAKLRIWLEPEANLLAPTIQAQTRSDGTVIFSQIHLGKYVLHVGGYPEGFYLKSAKIGGVDVLETGLNVDGSQPTETVDLEVSSDAGRIYGNVVHELASKPGTLVTLVPDPPRRQRGDLFRQSLTDPLGRFSFLGIPPGDFKLFAWENGDDNRINDLEFIRSHENLGKAVHIEEKRSSTVQLDEVIQSSDSAGQGTTILGESGFASAADPVSRWWEEIIRHESTYPKGTALYLTGKQ